MKNTLVPNAFSNFFLTNKGLKKSHNRHSENKIVKNKSIKKAILSNGFSFIKYKIRF